MEPIFYDIETTGLNPMIEPWYNQPTSEVTAIAVGHFPDWQEGGDMIRIDTYLNTGGEEYELIEDVLNWFESRYSFTDERMFRVGWNIKQFDDPYLCARCGRLNQDPSPLIKWDRLDMMRPLEIPQWWWEENKHDGKNRKYPKQDDYARFLNIEFKEGLDGSQMPEAFKEGEYEKIKDHVVDDMQVMMHIFQKEQDKLLKHFTDHYGMDKADVWID